MSPTQLIFIFLATTIILFIIVITVLNLWLYVIIGAIITVVGISVAMHYREREREDEIMWSMWGARRNPDRIRSGVSRSPVARSVTNEDRRDAVLRRRIKEEWDQFDGEDLR